MGRGAGGWDAAALPAVRLRFGEGRGVAVGQ